MTVFDDLCAFCPLPDTFFTNYEKEQGPPECPAFAIPAHPANPADLAQDPHLAQDPPQACKSKGRDVQAQRTPPKITECSRTFWQKRIPKGSSVEDMSAIVDRQIEKRRRQEKR